MSTRATGISEIGRLLSNVFGWGSRSAGPAITHAADDVAEAGAKAALKKLPDIAIDLSYKDLQKAGIEAAEKAFKASGMKGFRKASEGRLASKAENAMTGLVKSNAEGNYQPFMKEAKKSLDSAIASGDTQAIKQAEHEIQKIEEKISSTVSKYIGEHGDDISGFADRIGDKVKNGGAAYKTAAVVGKAATSKYIAVPTVMAGGAYYAFNKASELKDVVIEKLGLAGPLGLNLDQKGGASSLFNIASSGLKYMGISPEAATIITSLGTFGALYGAFHGVGAASGLSKIPAVGTLLNIAAFAATAYIVYSNYEESLKPRVDSTLSASAGITAPAPAM